MFTLLAGLIPDPAWLNSGDTSWQLTAATLVGLMSIPGLAVLYGGAVQRKWAVNSAMMAFYGFAIVLVVWVLWGFNMGFGQPWIQHGGFGFLGKPGAVLDHLGEQAQANIPLVSGIGAMPPFRFPQSSLVYFQFVFAAITPLLILGSVVGRINFKAWMLFVPLWSTFVYSVNAFLLWGGGYWSAQGAVDYSGGYVIHLAAGVSGFVAAAVVGPRLRKDRENPSPNNLLMVMAGAALLWLGWNGFNGGDPYFANPDASAAVLNTNICAGVAMLTWMFIDTFVTGKPQLLGAVNGMITGLVAITPAAGYVNGYGAILLGIVASAVPWFTMNKVAPNVGIFKRVDDALGVIHTHGFAGLIGGLGVGLLADSNMIVYYGTGKTSNVSITGGGHQFFIQLGAAATIIVWDGVLTFVILKLIGLVVPLRLPEAVLEIGDEAIHGEVVSGDFPPYTGSPGYEYPGGLAGVGVPAGTVMASSHGAPSPPINTR